MCPTPQKITVPKVCSISLQNAFCIELQQLTCLLILSRFLYSCAESLQALPISESNQIPASSAITTDTAWREDNSSYIVTEDSTVNGNLAKTAASDLDCGSIVPFRCNFYWFTSNHLSSVIIVSGEFSAGVMRFVKVE